MTKSMEKENVEKRSKAPILELSHVEIRYQGTICGS